MMCASTMLPLLAAAAALAASPAVASDAVLSDLFFTTASPCAALRALPTQHDLRAQLLPRDVPFDGSVTLSKSDTASGCALHVALRGELPTGAGGDAFALVRQVDASLQKQVATMLRTAEDAEQKSLTLERLRVKVADRDYSMDARAVADVATGQVTLNGDECAQFPSKTLLNELLTASVSDVAVVTGQVDVAKCAIGLDITGHAPSFGSTTEAVAFLKAADAKLANWFGAAATKQSIATLRSARLAFSPPKATMLEAAAAARSPVNAPTKQVTMGILMGLMMLTAMLVGVAYQKKRHEQSLQQRHVNASRAAQIRRVSYRMGYEPVRRKEEDLDAEEEEKDGLV